MKPTQKPYEFLAEKLQWYKMKAKELRMAVSRLKEGVENPLLLAGLEVLDKLARDVLSWCEYRDYPPSLRSANIAR
ncbi:MAG: hypothetical protein JRD89_00265 [Deltaproteobacteria bacterium]|nr:hypothetical protein [Deltaproteobacteria bacterium]